MEDSKDSTYGLITSLCESFGMKGEQLKKARSNCYGLLLGKTQMRNPRKFRDLEGTKDPTLNLLAWCYKINNEYGYSECAQQLEDGCDKLKLLYRDDVQSFNKVLTFLLCLKDLPKKTNKKLDLSSLPDIDDEMSKFNNMFKLPPIDEAMDGTSKDMFKLPLNINAAPANPKTSFQQLFSKCDILKDEGYSSPNKDNIWDVVSQMSLSKRRNWESYGCGPPDKEKPFLSELGELSSLWVENLESLYVANNLFPSFTIINNKLKPRMVFIKDLKFLLVGMPTETFNVGVQEEFFICPGIMVEGITPDAIERYCNSFLIAGTCYRALNQMATPNPNTRKYKYPGYVFAGFCESLSRYLQYYRTAVISISDETNFLTFQEKTQHLQLQLTTIASICKIGPYASETEHIPHGVGLINYLYQKVFGLSDRNLCMVLYSILYPCCQIYFSRFLQQWLIQGMLNDPHGEFFIVPNLKYLATRGRTYWSRSYGIREDIIPDFLVDLKDDILFCGKIMNLLKMCSPNNKLCLYLMGKDPLVLSCCLTRDTLTELEQNASKYYLRASEECGSKFTFEHNVQLSREDNQAYLRLIAKKRAATLRRIELQRQKAARELHEQKLAELLDLKEQHEAALEEKQLNIYKDIEKEIKTIEDDLRIEQMREKLIEDEAMKMIDYYSELSHLADLRKETIERHIRAVSTIQIDTAPPVQKIESGDALLVRDKINSSSESFYSAPDASPTTPQSDEERESLKSDEQPQETQNMRSSESMDQLNANFRSSASDDVEHQREKSSMAQDVPRTSQQQNIQQAVENFEFARRIKQKVLNQELGIPTSDLFQGRHMKIDDKPPITHLTAAQRNKLKILSTEFGINIIKDEGKTDGVLTAAQMNRNKVLGHDACFSANYGDTPLDNANFVNKNMKSSTGSVESGLSKLTTPMTKSRSLQLDFNKAVGKSDSDKPIPMSVDSTPVSDLPQVITPMSDFPRSTTPSSMVTSIETRRDSFPISGEGIHFDEFFSFSGGTSKTSTTSSYYQRFQEYRPTPQFSKRVSVEEARGISKNSLKLFLHESVSIPVLTQLKLANNEILKYFINELQYLKHLDSLRDYFFLQDGEFARNITENLFEKLYGVNFPLDLINCRSLQSLVSSALDNSCKPQDNSKHLAFKINSMPKCFDLGDPDVLDCLSLTYKVHWPLNIVLPSDVVSKYDQVFKFLIKLNRVSWVLKKMFLELKILAKETGKKEIYLMSSPQYRRLHQCRHVMSHFVQTLQNYIVGEVLQPSWTEFERSLSRVTNLDELSNSHSVYITDIVFRCMLNQKSVALRSIVHKTFVVILKFYDYLRSRHWKCEEGTYIHPNFNKLDKIFKNFEEFVVYFFKVVRKVAKSGYQPCLNQFLDVLDVNDYYSKKLVKPAGMPGGKGG